MEILSELCHLFKVRVQGRELSSTGYTGHVEAAEQWEPERRPEALDSFTESGEAKILN